MSGSNAIASTGSGGGAHSGHKGGSGSSGVVVIIYPNNSLEQENPRTYDNNCLFENNNVYVYNRNNGFSMPIFIAMLSIPVI